MAGCACKNLDKQPLPYEKLDEIIVRYKGDPSAIIPILQDIQESLGYIPKESISYSAEKLGVSPAKIYGIVTFYAQFRMTPKGKHSIMVCEGTACHVNGAKGLGNAITDELGIRGGETTGDKLFTLEYVACVGCCSLAPVIVVDGEVHANMTPEKVRKVLKQYRGNGKDEEN